MSSGPETLMDRQSVADAAGVTAQAVTNWARRHRDFPRAARHGSGSGYPASAVAEWLDTRRVPRPSLRRDEQPGRTYGARFRAAVGLPPPRSAEHRRPGHPLNLLDQEELWTPLEELLRKSEEPALFESVVLSLLCLGGADPVGWAAMTRASAETIHETVLRTQQRQPDHLASATAILRTIPAIPWWRHRLRDLVDILSADRLRTAPAFDFLLDKFAEYRHSSPDEYLVPTELAAMMVGMLDPEPGSRIHDPCCGAGILLVAAGEYLRNAETGPPAIMTGRAATARTRNLATMNVAMHDIPVDLDARLPAAPGEVDAEAERFDIVLLNPPFGRRSWSLPAEHQQRPWPYGEPAPHNAAFAWLQTAVAALAPGGRAAVVMPDSSTFGSTTREQGIRGEMIERGVIYCVVALPGHLFRETTSPVTVWILECPVDEADRGVLLIDAREAAHKDDPTHQMLTERSCRTVVESYKRWLTGTAPLPIAVDNVIATPVSVAELREHGYDLQPVTYRDRRRGEAAEQRVPGRLRTLAAELARLDAVARQADAALDRRLRELTPWTR